MNNHEFNKYITIILSSDEHSDVIFDEIKVLEKEKKANTIKQYIQKFSQFNETYALNASESIINTHKKFMFVDRSFALINKIKQLKTLIC